MPNNNNKTFQPKIDPNYVPNAPKEVLDKPIGTLNIYPETQAKLEAVGIKTVFDVAILEMKYLYRIENMSKKDVFAVMRGLHGLKLDFKKSERVAPPEGANQTNNTITANTNVAGDEPKQNRFKRSENNRTNQPRENDSNKNVRPTENRSDNVNGNRNLNTNNSDQKFDRGSRFDKNVPREQRPNNAPPQRERMNTREDFNENGTMKPQRERVNSRDFDRNGKKRNQTQDNSNTKQVPIKKPPIKLPPLIIEDGLYKFFRTGKWGYKDDKGVVVIEPQFDEAYNFSEGMAGVELHERVGFINKAGEVVIEAIYDTVCSFTDGLASVTQGEVSWYIDKEGNKQFDMEFESATPFKNGSALVKKDGKWNFISKETGELRPR